MPHPYHLRTSAGPDIGKLTPIPVNTLEKTSISTPNATIHLTLHIKNLRPASSSSSSSSPCPSSSSSTSSLQLPSTSPYFSHKNHTNDLYALCITLVPKAPISGNALVWGNHFSHPIRDSLPLAFPLLLSAARWIDPSLDADVYADEPWIYGPALASMSTISTSSSSSNSVPQVEKKKKKKKKERKETEEGGEEDDEAGGLVEDNGLGLTAKARRKHFLTEGKRKEWVFEAGKAYKMEFSGPWLDFGEFRVVLPGFRVDILKYWDGQPLRFVLRNKESGEVYLVVEFDLVDGEEGEGSDGRSTSSGEDND